MEALDTLTGEETVALELQSPESLMRIRPAEGTTADRYNVILPMLSE